jgi:quinol monooxygenase YgiN
MTAADVFWMLELSLKPGNEAGFTALMTEMVAATSANEAGALSYEWSLSCDGATCHIFERYADSAAVLTHLGTFGERFAGRFLEMLTPTRCVVYGSPSPQVKEGLAVLNPVYMRLVGGFNR